MEKSITSTLKVASASPEISISQTIQSSERQLQQRLKRAFDVGVALTFLILFAPFLLGVALLLLLVQGRPILFKHERIGWRHETFNCFKFRTMVNEAGRVLEEYLAANPTARLEWEGTQKLKNDPRVTPLGHVMRRLSIDEVPQVFNVLRGDMSLVGPRPIVSSEVRFYGSHISFYDKFRPGITGSWQISGRSNTSYARRVQLDVDYARNWSLTKDLVILAKTIPAVLTSDGSC